MLLGDYILPGHNHLAEKERTESEKKEKGIRILSYQLSGHPATKHCTFSMNHRVAEDCRKQLGEKRPRAATGLRRITLNYLSRMNS